MTRVCTMTSSFLLLLLVFVLATTAAASPLYYSYEKDDACSFSLVESIPENLTFNSSIRNLDTYDAYQALLSATSQEVKFASFYWTLRGSDVMQNPGNIAEKGEKLLSSVIDRSQKVPVRIAVNIGGFKYNESDIQLLMQQPNIYLTGVNVSGLFGSGVLHTKFVLADNAHAYIGSSNMDWRSLTQVKELGLLMMNCPPLAMEVAKIFDTYWLTGKENRVPNPWPDSLTAAINASHPWVATVGGHEYSIYLGVSPAQLCPPGWSRDIDAIVDAIASARKFVHIAVMDYQAATPFQGHKFWGVIDNAVRTAALRNITIRLLVSHWKHSDPFVQRFLFSLTALNSSKSPIEGKFFIVPAFTPVQQSIPFGRVNHNKYMVTESATVICTSNWDGSYFSHTAGTAIYIKETGKGIASKARDQSIVEKVQAVFLRDWNSGYAHSLPRV